MKKFLILRARKFHFSEIKEIIFGVDIFYFFDLGLKSALGCSTLYYWHTGIANQKVQRTNVKLLLISGIFTSIWLV